MNGRDTVFANIEQAEFWSELAPTWFELEDQLRRWAGPWAAPRGDFNVLIVLDIYRPMRDPRAWKTWSTSSNIAASMSSA